MAVLNSLQLPKMYKGRKVSSCSFPRGRFFHCADSREVASQGEDREGSSGWIFLLCLLSHPFLLLCWVCAPYPQLFWPAPQWSSKSQCFQLLLPYFVMFKPWAWHSSERPVSIPTPMSFMSLGGLHSGQCLSYHPPSQPHCPKPVPFLSSLQEALLIHHGCVQIHFLLSPLRAHCSFIITPKVRLLFIMRCSPHLSPSRLQAFVWLFSSLNAKFSRFWSSSYSSL